MAVARPMTASEKYFALTDVVWPFTIQIVAELSICHSVDHLESTWQRFVERRTFPRLAVTEQLTLVDTDPQAARFSSRDVPVNQWHAEMDALLSTRIGWGVPAHMVVLRSPEDNRSRVVLAGHHSIVDGRVGVAHVQMFLRALAGADIPEQQGLSVARQSPSWAWQNDRGALREIATQIKSEQEAAGSIGPAKWPPVSRDRDLSTRPLVIDADQSKRWLAGMSERGLKLLPTWSAAWLLAVRGVLGDDERVGVQLGTAVDLSPTELGPGELAGVSVGVVANRFAVTEATSLDDLSRSTADALVRSMKRGDGDLFLHLSRVAQVSDPIVGGGLIERGIQASPPTTSVTNLGIIQDAGDPEWVSWMCGYLGPTPHQVVFVSGLGYRGQLVNSVTTDGSRLSATDADAICQAAVDRMESIAIRP